MKKKIIILLGLISILLVGCGSKSQLNKVKLTEREESVLAKVGANLIEYELKFTDEISSESIVNLFVDKYEYGNKIESVSQIASGQFLEESSVKLSWGIKNLGIDKEKFVLNVASGKTESIIEIPKSPQLRHVHAFDNVVNIEKDKDYYIAANLFSDGYIHNFPKTYIDDSFMENLKEYELAYVLTLKVTDDWIKDNSGGAK